MYDRFTDRAREVYQQANQEARSFNHEYIGTEHVLLGLVKQSSGLAASVLNDLNVDPRKIQLEVEKLVQFGPDPVPMGRLPQTPRAKKVIEYSMEAARNLGHVNVGTEHILLGLLREGEGVAAQVLMNFGLTIGKVRESLQRLLTSPDATLSAYLLAHRSQSAPAQLPPVAQSATTAAQSDKRLQQSVQHRRSDRYEKFTDRARKVMTLANDEARRLNHEYLGTEHILLGLAKEQYGVATNVLRNLGIDLTRVRDQVERLVQCGQGAPASGELPATPRAQKLIEHACEEARQLNHNYPGTEHLLLALVRDSESLASKVLLELGVTFEQVREETLNLLGHGNWNSGS